MQSFSVFLGITKIADFRLNADLIRTQEVCHVSHMVFGFTLGKI